MYKSSIYCPSLPLSPLPTRFIQFKETSRGAYKYTTLPCIIERNIPQNVPPVVLCSQDTLFVRTQICSTKLTQNGECTITPSQPSPPPSKLPPPLLLPSLFPPSSFPSLHPPSQLTSSGCYAGEPPRRKSSPPSSLVSPRYQQRRLSRYGETRHS